jgi:agmatinase
MAERLGALTGEVYLSIDVDGLDPSVVPSTGTPQPGGLGWRQVIDIIRRVSGSTRSRLVGADVVELVASPHPPGCDIVVARLAAKILAFWARGHA